MDLIFASHNENKVQEVRYMLPKEIGIFSLNDIGFHEEIEETANTLHENAKIKAKSIFEVTGKNVFADDSGLFVEALNGEPGVFSSRYAGTGNSADNISKLLRNLGDSSNRNAYFKSVICLIMDGKEYFFEGEVHGQIINQEKGTKGFGYDPIFVADGYSVTFAEMNPDEKNIISHRYKATQKLINFIKNI